MLKHIIFLSLLTFALSSQAQLKIYRQLPASEIPLSPHFKVEVKQGNSAYQEIYAYQIIPNSNGHVTKNDQFANFGFNPAGGPVSIRVTRKDGVALTTSNSRLKNKTLSDVSQSHSNGALILTCSSAKRHLYVSADGKAEYPLMIFVDPYANRAFPANAKVVKFAARSTPYVQNAQYDRYTIPNDVDVVEIEDGAIVKGTIHTNNNRTKPLLVTGRGVILGNGGVLHGAANIPYNALVITKGDNHIVENIMVINSRHFTIDVGKGALLDNAKMYGYDANNDGIVGKDDCIIQNVFSKVNDDHIKLYNERMIVRNCNFWVQQNGALFQLAWNAIVPGSNCLVENCEVLAWEARCGDPRLNQGGVARTFINLREYEGTNAPVSKNNTFRNIYVQGQLDRFIGINGKYQGSKPISLENYVLENITIDKKPTRYSWMYTGGSSKLDFSFKNVKIAGQCLTAANYQFITEGNVQLNYLGCSSSSDTQAPSKPGAISVSQITENSAILSWAASTDNIKVTGYDVYINNTKFSSVSGNSATLDELECNSAYTVKVQAKDLAGNLSVFSNNQTFTTAACTITGPANITNLNAQVLSCESVKLTWSDVENETGYRVRRKLASESVYVNIGDVDANATTYTDFTAEENTSYVYMVRPLVDGMAVAISNLQEIQMPLCVIENKLPEVSLIAPSENNEFEALASIQLTASASDADGSVLKVEFFEGNNKLGTDNTAPFEFAWNNVAPGTYTLTAKAWDNDDAVSTSQSISITVLEPSISDIDDLEAVVENCETVTLTWSDVENETGYRIRRKLASESAYTNLDDVDANVTTYTDITAEESTNYIYMVRPLKDGSAVGLSNLQEVTTSKCVITSLKDDNSIGVRVYPNPVADYLIINAYGANWQLKNSTGSLIRSGSEEKINMSDLPAGLYFMNLEGEVIKIVKK